MAKVVLSDGKEVEISTVLFNKEQNINVSKTYVTTVKKAVTRVGEKFYHIESKEEERISEPVVEAVPEMPEVEKPVLEETVQETTVESEPTNEEIMNSFVAPLVEEEKTVDTVVSEEPKEEVKVDSVDELATEPQVETVLPVVEEIKPEPEVVEVPVKESDVEPVKDVLPQPLKEEEPVGPIIPTVSAIPLSAVESVKTPEVESVTLPVEPNPEPIQEEPELIFDASKESNLNIALGEVTSDTSVKVDDASSFREFGQDSTSIESFAQESQVVEAPVLAEPTSVKKLTRSKGFANSKFVTVIAILFFVAACVFLGYEIFNYFQLTK